MRIVFFGLGSIGTRQARLMKDNFKYELLAYRSNRNSKKNKLNIDEVYDLKDVLKWKPNVAFITNPTSKHIKYATFCAKNGINLFIEKPLSSNMEGISDLLQIVRNNNIKTYVAYCLRFHPAIIWLKNHLKENKALHVTVNASSYLPNWRKGIDHLKNYSALKDMGGGIILDFSHEIDYLYYLFGDIKDIKVNSERISNVTVDSEDFVDVLLKFSDGIFGNLHINFLSRLNRREIIVDFKNSTVIVDLIDNKVSIKNGEEKVIKFDSKRDDYFISQLNYFFDKLNNGKMMNDLKDSMNVFENIIKIKKRAGL